MMLIEVMVTIMGFVTCFLNQYRLLAPNVNYGLSGAGIKVGRQVDAVS
jgi:hypothetical protein